MNSIYVYPATFTPEENEDGSFDGYYNVNFPDVYGTHTFGENLGDAFLMAEDVLALALYGYEAEGREMPVPSRLEDIEVEEGGFVNYVRCDTMRYRKKFNKKAIKKTLTIPEWLNEEATKVGVNFSQVLQKALHKEITRKQ